MGREIEQAISNTFGGIIEAGVVGLEHIGGRTNGVLGVVNYLWHPWSGTDTRWVRFRKMNAYQWHGVWGTLAIYMALRRRLGWFGVGFGVGYVLNIISQKLEIPQALDIICVVLQLPSFWHSWLNSSPHSQVSRGIVSFKPKVFPTPREEPRAN